MIIGSVQLQDLLPDEASRLVIGLLRLAMSPRAGRYWAECQETLSALRGIGPDDEDEQSRFARDLDAFALDLAKRYPAPPANRAEAVALVRDTLSFIGPDRLLAAHPAYAQANWLGKILEAAVLHLTASVADWSTALDAYEGVHAVPLMTIHKSKGLEYHTVIFVGLDDDAWRRSFVEDQAEATASFFVAFTRAKQRVLFTYCARRGARKAIVTLYQLLLGAGVQIIQVA